MASGDDDMPPLEDDIMDDLRENDGDDWDDDDDEQENILVGPTQCLFCEETLNSAPEVFSHCESAHSFSIQTVCAQWHLDCIGYIKLVNYIRSQHPPPDFLNSIPRHTPISELPWAPDIYMQPAQTDDLLLLFDVEDESFALGAQSQHRGAPSPDDEEVTLRSSHLEQLMQDLKAAQERADNAEERASNLRDTIESIKAGVRDLMSEPPTQPANSCQSSSKGPVSAIKKLTEKEDEAYFSSYADYGIHGEMLKDRVRTESYRDFMYENPDLFAGKTVLDVGCGTGILSMFAAKAGAAQVISVDQSEIIYQAMGIIRENKLEDRITWVKGRLEDVTLPVEKVDIIVSEWMGYFLLFESMLDTVVVARDRYLKPGGQVFPDKCSIWLSGLADKDLWQSTIGYWDNVYGFSMTCMKGGTVEEPSVTLVNKDKIITEPVKVKEIDINTCTLSDLEFSASFTLCCHGDGELMAVVGYFDIGFEAGCTKQIHFSTGPADTATHWKQTAFFLENPITVSAGMALDGRIQVKKDIRDPRALVVKIRLGDKAQLYHMR